MTQKYYCEDENCGEDISEDEQRYHCAGCLGWFCSAHARIFPYVSAGVWTHVHVCSSCLLTWQRLCELRGREVWLYDA
jgi:hypothetical protein